MYAGFSGNDICSGTSKNEEIFIQGNCERGVFAVFDGIGGGSDGKAASKICSEYLLENSDRVFEMPAEIIDVFTEMNDKVCDYTKENKLYVCGSTASAVVAADDRIYASNLGDSRIYYFKSGLNQLSVEHTILHNGKRALTQYAGIPYEELVVEPHFCSAVAEQNVQVLICSDGLTDMVSEKRITEILSENCVTLDKCRKLADEALLNGGRDNITIILLEWG